MTRSFRFARFLPEKSGPSIDSLIEQHTVCGERSGTIAKNLPARVVAPIVQDVPKEDHVGTVGIRTRDQIGRFGGESVAETVRLDAFTGNTAYGLEIRDDALQVWVFEADRDRLPAWAACHIHDAAAVTEVEAFGDELSLRDAEAIHHVGEST